MMIKFIYKDYIFVELSNSELLPFFYSYQAAFMKPFPLMEKASY